MSTSTVDASQVSALIREVFDEYATVVVGQPEVFESLLVALLSGGHLLLEGVPGLAKTLAVRTMAGTLGADFARIQCTPDMLPSDIVGTQIYNPQGHQFVTQLGPVNHQFLLVDEINRTSAKTQSALLEAMQERQVSIGGQTYDLPRGFIVVATQNPIEQEGTYLLPEAQLDRFLFKHVLSYPSAEDEIRILKTHNSSGTAPAVGQRATIEQIEQLQAAALTVTVDDKIVRYIAQMVEATRTPDKFNLPELKSYIEFGA